MSEGRKEGREGGREGGRKGIYVWLTSCSGVMDHLLQKNSSPSLQAE